MLIGINGGKGVGKNTVGTYLAKKYKFKEDSFARSLKESAAALLKIEPEEWEEYKNDDEVCLYLQRADDTPRSILTAREFLQRYGTESHREIFGYDFWVDQVLDKYEESSNVVITDARFENELEAIHEMSGINIRIVRPGIGNGDTHASEQPPPTHLIDHKVFNTGSISELYAKIDDLMESYDY